MDAKWINSVYFRSHAIACVNQFIISRTQALMLHIDGFIEVSPGLSLPYKGNPLLTIDGIWREKYIWLFTTKWMWTAIDMNPAC